MFISRSIRAIEELFVATNPTYCTEDYYLSDTGTTSNESNSEYRDDSSSEEDLDILMAANGDYPDDAYPGFPPVLGDENRRLDETTKSLGKRRQDTTSYSNATSVHAVIPSDSKCRTCSLTLGVASFHCKDCKSPSSVLCMECGKERKRCPVNIDHDIVFQCNCLKVDVSPKSRAIRKYVTGRIIASPELTRLAQRKHGFAEEGKTRSHGRHRRCE